MSSVLRVALSNVRMPRSQRITLRVAARQDVFGRQQPLLDRGGDAALEHAPACASVPSSRSSVKFCMLRAPTWKMSAYLSMTSIWLMSITSVMSFRSCALAASRSIRRPSSPSPWKLYGELRGLNAPPRSTLAPARFTAAAVVLHLLFGLGRARSGHHDDLVAADAHVADGEDGVFGLEGAAGELVRLGDAQHFVHAVQQLDQARIDLAAADHAEHGARRARSSGARPCRARPDGRSPSPPAHRSPVPSSRQP